MKDILLLLLLFSTLACQIKEESSSKLVDWKNKKVDFILSDSLEAGGTYLSVYSHIYSMTQDRTHDLTVTISLRNTNRSDTIYITNAEYYDTQGSLIRTYFDDPVYLQPLETISIVIAGADQKGGAGANFIFDWKIEPGTKEPLFEAIMISTLGQQGLSFSTKGERIY